MELFNWFQSQNWISLVLIRVVIYLFGWFHLCKFLFGSMAFGDLIRIFWLIPESKWSVEYFWWQACLGSRSNCLWWSKFSGPGESFKWYVRYLKEKFDICKVTIIVSVFSISELSELLYIYMWLVTMQVPKLHD